MIRIEAGRFYAETMERGGVEAYPSPLGKNMHLWKWNNVNDMHVSTERERERFNEGGESRTLHKQHDLILTS